MTDTHNSAEGWLYAMPGPGEPDTGHLEDDGVLMKPLSYRAVFGEAAHDAFVESFNPPPFDRRSFADSWAVAGAIQSGKVHTPAEVAARVRLRAVVAFLVGVVVGAGAVSLWG